MKLASGARRRLWLSAAIGTGISLSAWFGMTYSGLDWINGISTILLLPGMFPAMIVSRNVHDFSLFAAAVFCSLLYSAAVYVPMSMWSRWRQTQVVPSGSISER